MLCYFTQVFPLGDHFWPSSPNIQVCGLTNWDGHCSVFINDTWSLQRKEFLKHEDSISVIGFKMKCRKQSKSA